MLFVSATGTLTALWPTPWHHLSCCSTHYQMSQL